METQFYVDVKKDSSIGGDTTTTISGEAEATEAYLKAIHELLMDLCGSDGSLNGINIKFFDNGTDESMDCEEISLNAMAEFTIRQWRGQPMEDWEVFASVSIDHLEDVSDDKFDEYPKADWLSEVASGNIDIGYADWVTTQKEVKADDGTCNEPNCESTDLDGIGNCFAHGK